jgi:antitoxin component YwqK of YwqJK toxin-antitoxin module
MPSCNKGSANRIALAVLLLLLSLLLVGCSAEIDASEAIERSGVMYRMGSQKPFTGVVAGRGRNEGYRNYTYTYKKEYKNGILEGRSYFYYLEGQVESIEPYKEGVLNGVVTQYYPNGQLKARIHFVDGFRGGEKGEMFWQADGSRSDSR